jgi:dTDP-4-dehydrorhamnose reductase
MMKILVTGANGFIGHYIVQYLLAKGHEVVATGKGNCRLPFTGLPLFWYATLDFTDRESVNQVFEEYKPSVVVHAGANGKPDECELDKEAAYRINVTGTETVLQASARYKAFFVFLSTDFVFEGIKGMYSEEDPTGPVNYYGETKLLAEKLVKKYVHPFCIVRTILVYGRPFSGRNNILTVVKEKLEKGESYHLYEDQVRTPTYVEDLAAAIVTMIEKKAIGIWHIGGSDTLTPFEMACLTAAFHGLDKTLLKRVTRDTFSQPALRPLKTGLNIDKAMRELGYKPTPFSEGLKKTFSKDL